MEYGTQPCKTFCGLVEAYFGRNDFFPCTLDEFKKYDPVGCRMMVDCWGLPKESSPLHSL